MTCVITVILHCYVGGLECHTLKSVVKTIRGEGGGWEDNREGPTLTLHTPGSHSFVLERIMLFE